MWTLLMGGTVEHIDGKLSVYEENKQEAMVFSLGLALNNCVMQ